jgi:hypothetical protein
MRVTEHFKQRLSERFGYEIEDLVFEIINPIYLSKNSEELKFFPQFRNSFKKYPDSIIIILNRLNMCLISSKKTLITCYSI